MNSQKPRSAGLFLLASQFEQPPRRRGQPQHVNAGMHHARQPFQRMLEDAVRLYSRPDLPQGCMVVSSAASVSAENDGLKTWLAEHRLQRTQQIVERLRQAVQAGELPAGTDADSLGDFFAVFLHGLSIQARDGVTETRLLAAVKVALIALGDA